jgi:hypothetical protein
VQSHQLAKRQNSLVTEGAASLSAEQQFSSFKSMQCTARHTLTVGDAAYQAWQARSLEIRQFGMMMNLLLQLYILVVLYAC